MTGVKASLARAATSIILVATTHVCCDKTRFLFLFFFCRDIILSQQKFRRDKSWPHFCHDKIRTTKMCCVTCSDEKDISSQDCRVIKCAHAHSFVGNKVRGRK